MKAIARLVISLSLALAGAVGAIAIAAGAADDMPRQMALALRWIEQNSNYRDVPPPRSYALVSDEVMRSKAMNLANASSANAMYSCDSQTLWLMETFDPKKVTDSSFLVHELAHHAQCVLGGPRSECVREREAYDLQFKYLEQFARGARERLPEQRKRFDEVVAWHGRR
jgi:hypothetical protein